MKSKNKPVSEEEGPTPNSSKQWKLTQHYILRHVKSSLTGIGGVKIKQLNVNWTCFQVLCLALQSLS